MGWADRPIEGLRRGQTVQFRPRGHSMRGKIESGQQVTVAPLDREPEKDQIVLCRVRGRCFLHLVKAVRGHGTSRRYLIGNNRGGTNGWIPASAIFGRCTAVED